MVAARKVIELPPLLIDGNDELSFNLGIPSVKVLAAAMFPNTFFFLPTIDIINRFLVEIHYLTYLS